VLIEIKNRFNDAVIFSHAQEDNSIKNTLELAFKSGANLDGANLDGANLRGANLEGASLEGASLEGSTYGIATLKNGLLQLLGKYWPIFIFDAHIKIGCQLHSTADWESFDDECISRMAGNALEFWIENKELILTLAKHHQKNIEQASEENTEAT
jgi:uncharacterized protein YjbI with pentapeptide repeats